MVCWSILKEGREEGEEIKVKHIKDLSLQFWSLFQVKHVYPN